ncbi:MAG: flagellar biosynthetic protein FliQ [Bryobacteraceae bacterium]
MSPEMVIEVLRQALLTACVVSLPLLAVGFLIGIVMSLVQIVTSIQDTAFGAVPRLAAFLLAFIVTLPWMLQKMVAYSTAIFGDLGKYAR